MRTRHIEIFHAIYAAGSISQAAGVLKVSQPALIRIAMAPSIALSIGANAMCDRGA